MAFYKNHVQTTWNRNSSKNPFLQIAISTRSGQQNIFEDLKSCQIIKVKLSGYVLSESSCQTDFRKHGNL